jgi:hypothetical protein
MTDNEKNICMALTPYLAVFPDSKLTHEGIILYASILSEIPADQIKTAMVKLGKTAKFFPRPAEICEAVESLQETAARQNGTGTLTAGEAWEDVQREIKRRGYYSTEPWHFANNEVEKAARQFGLYELATLELEAVNTARAQFNRIYDSVVKTEKEYKANSKVIQMIEGKKIKAIGAE